MDVEKCKFLASNPLLNDIWNICKNGVKYGAQEVYVDCPSREKGQYLGDATVATHAHLYLSGDLRLFKKALKDFDLYY
jgi:alpha-L-rhamnosidase